VHEITEHHTEKEWERYACENSWIHFFVAWDTVSVNNLLENCGELVQFVISWFGQPVDVIRAFNNIQTSDVFFIHEVQDLGLEIVCFWSPNETVKKHAVLLEHIHVNRDRLLSENKEVVYLEHRHISFTLLVDLFKVVSERHLGLCDNSSGAYSVILSFHEVLVQSVDVDIESFTGETLANSPDLVLHDIGVLTNDHIN
jgi:hypothetical protein